MTETNEVEGTEEASSLEAETDSEWQTTPEDTEETSSLEAETDSEWQTAPEDTEETSSLEAETDSEWQTVEDLESTTAQSVSGEGSEWQTVNDQPDEPEEIDLKIETTDALEAYLVELKLPPALLKSLRWLYAAKHKHRPPYKEAKFWPLYIHPRFQTLPENVKEDVYNELRGLAGGFSTTIQTIKRTGDIQFHRDRFHVMDIIAATIGVRGGKSEENKAARFISSFMNGSVIPKLHIIAQDSDFQKHFERAMDWACKQPISDKDVTEVIDIYLHLSEVLPEYKQDLLLVRFRDFYEDPSLYRKYLECFKADYDQAIQGIEALRKVQFAPKEQEETPAEKVETEEPTATEEKSTSNLKIVDRSESLRQRWISQPFVKLEERVSRTSPGNRIVIGNEVYRVGNGYLYLPPVNSILALQPSYLYIRPHAKGELYYFDYSRELYNQQLPSDLPIELWSLDRLNDFGYVLLDGAIRVLGRGYYYCNGQLIPSKDMGMLGAYVQRSV